MIALDTNLLVRFLVNDDEGQGEKVMSLLSEAEKTGETFFVPLLVIQELIWVLDAAYGCSRAEIIDAIDKLTRMPVLHFEKLDTIHGTLNIAIDSNFELPDLLIAHSAYDSGCDFTYTFDKRASKFSLFKRV